MHRSPHTLRKLPVAPAPDPLETKHAAQRTLSRYLLSKYLFGVLLALCLGGGLEPGLAQDAQRQAQRTPVQAAPSQTTSSQRTQAQSAPTQSQRVQAAPQPRPEPRGKHRFRVSTLTPVAGKTVTVSGGGLPPGSQVTARVTAPGGALTRESARVEEQGRFNFELLLPTAGKYRLVVRGQGLDETRTLNVRRPQPAAPKRSPKGSAKRK